MRRALILPPDLIIKLRNKFIPPINIEGQYSVGPFPFGKCRQLGVLMKEKAEQELNQEIRIDKPCNQLLGRMIYKWAWVHCSDASTLNKKEVPPIP